MKILYKNKKGFTLIELLGVIVILGIIALIVVPTVKTIMDESKKKSFTNSAYGIIKAADLYYARKDMLDEIEGDITFEFPNSAEELELQGELPKQGTMTINEDGDISLVISNGDYCITKGFNDKDITVTEDVENCKIAAPGLLATLATTGNMIVPSISTSSATSTSVEVPACATNGSVCANGTPIMIEVNESETYGFYVIEDTGTEVTLIMEKNLGDKVAWNGNTTDNTEGPVTALNYLNSQTDGWTNIPAIESYTYINNENGTTNTYGYQKLEIENGVGKLTSQDGSITTSTATSASGDAVVSDSIIGTSRARLLTYEEANKLYTENSNTAPPYLLMYLWSNDNTSLPYGYWFLTSASSYSDCAITSYQSTFTIEDRVYNETNGVRPIITLSK